MAERHFFDAAFARYAVTSALATATDFAVANGLHAFGVGPFAATFFGCVCGGGVSFALSRGWTFRAGAGRAVPQLVRFLLVWATSALLNSFGVPSLMRVVPAFPVAWFMVRGAVYLAWNYPLTRWFVFHGSEPSERLNAQ